MAKGKIQFQITGADIPGTINACNQAGLEILEIKNVGPISACATIHSVNQARFIGIAEKLGNEVDINTQSGLRYNLFNRILLLISFFLLTLLTVWIPGRIFFVAVEGNQNITSEQIIFYAEQSGVRFGAKRDLIRSSVVKNRLIEKLPQLQWVGVNIQGCCAVIQVREKEGGENLSTNTGFRNIIAKTDGIVTAVTVTSGIPNCAVGDAVKKGQILISGYQNYGNVVKLQRAEGEVFAKTIREIHLTAPCGIKETDNDAVGRGSYSLIIGKKRVNLINSSGISGVGCDRIRKEYTLVLPGGFCLPVLFVVDRYFENTHKPSDAIRLTNDALLAAADYYMASNLVMGQVVDKRWTFGSAEDVAELSAVYNCTEMIGIEQAEELQIEYGKND